MTRWLKGIVLGETNRGGRSHQEDRYIADRIELSRYRTFWLFKISVSMEVWILAVFDGHGDSAEAAEFCAANFNRRFQDAFCDNKGDIKKALRETISFLHESTKLMSSGSTLSAVVIPEHGQVAYIAVLGDSPIIIFDRTKSIWIGPEHNARSNLSERMSALARGAIYEDGYLVESSSGIRVQLSRALGDRELDCLSSREPEIFTVNLDLESFILVASDGLLDSGHADTKKQISRLVTLVKNGANAKDLVFDALDRKTGDNTTAILWKAA